MVPLGQLTKETILSDEVFTEVFDQEDELYKSRLLLSLEDRAAELGVKKKFQELVKAYKRVDRELKKQKKDKDGSVVLQRDNYTDFDYYEDGTQLYCGAWIANETGVVTYNMFGEVLACYHPILPVERLKNMETGEEQLLLAYKRNNKWHEIKVPKDVISTANKITTLSKFGVAVTSENARHLVRYLSDIENMNDNRIKLQQSTSKLGWNKKDFIPYDTEIIFDGDSRFKQIFESIAEEGDRDVWMEHVKKIRKSGRIEAKFLLASSFASVLVQMLGGLPFFVDLWGETEGGKTVALMLAASVWACPDENGYIKDYKGTDVGLEAISDCLNNLPLILDDTSKKNRRIEDNFEGLVYDLCSGKGKTRSNRELGVNRESHWRNCILTNGERPLSSYVSQGGAINRILEVEAGNNIFPDPQETVAVLKRNYGFAGKMFVEVVKEMGVDAVREIQKSFQKKMLNSEKMQKQTISLSIVLTADKIATDRIFMDGQYISIADAQNVLIDREELSDNERCYRYLLDKIAMNNQRFDMDTRCEKWGIIEGDYAIIYSQAFGVLCAEAGFSKKSFLAWADKKCLIQTQGGRTTKLKKMFGTTNRCVFLKLDTEEPEEEMFK